MKKFAIIICLFCLVLNSCKDKQENETVLKLNWIYTGAFAPEALASEVIAKQNNIVLDLEIGGQGKDPLKLVGKNEFGIAAADEILRANDKGGDFVIIGVVNNNSPACFISLKKDSINVPKDFENKKIGVLPFGSTGLIYKIMMKKNNVDLDKVSEITVYPDLKIFTSGNHQVQPAFVFDEPVTLEKDGYKFNILEPKNFGVNFKGSCYFTTKATIKESPELVQSFINTMVISIENAIANPAKAVSALKLKDETVNEQRELKVWQKGIEYYKGYNGLPLKTNIDDWKDMVDEMLAFGELKNRPELKSIINTTFVDKYYSKND